MLATQATQFPLAQHWQALCYNCVSRIDLVTPWQSVAENVACLLLTITDSNEVSRVLVTGGLLERDYVIFCGCSLSEKYKKGAHRALCLRCAKSRLFFTTGSHGSQSPEFCTLQPLLAHQGFFVLV